MENSDERKHLGLFQHLNNIMPKARQASLFTDIMELSYHNGVLNTILHQYIYENGLDDKYDD